MATDINLNDIDWSSVESELQNQNTDLQNLSDSSDMSSTEKSGVNYEFISKLPIELIAVIGKQRMLMKDLLKKEVGSILELDKKIGEPIFIYIHSKLVAKAEIVIEHEKFSLKIIEILDKKERLETVTK